MGTKKGMFWSLVAGAAVVAIIAITVQHARRSSAGTGEAGPARSDSANVIVGRATSETTMRAPLSGGECVYWTVMVTKPAAPDFAFSESQTRVVGLETASGERLRFTRNAVRYTLSSVSASETKVLALRDMPMAVRALLKREGEDDVVFEVTETTLARSSLIYVTGTKTAPDELNVDTIYDAPPRPPLVRPGPAF